MSFSKATKNGIQAQQDQTPEEQHVNAREGEQRIPDERRLHSSSSISSGSISNPHPDRQVSTSSTSPTSPVAQTLPSSHDIPPQYSPWDPNETADVNQRGVVGGTEGQRQRHVYDYPPEKSTNNHDTNHKRHGGYWRQESGENPGQTMGGPENYGVMMNNTVNASRSDIPPSRSDALGPPAWDWMDDVGMGMGGNLARMPSKASISGDGRISITLSPSGFLGVKNRKTAEPKLANINTVNEGPDEPPSYLASLSNLVNSHTYESKKQEKEDHFLDDGRIANAIPQPPPVTPRLNIVMQIIGSRGDIQPFLSLALVLAKPPYNHRIRLATHACFEKFITEVSSTHGLSPENKATFSKKGSIEFFPLAGDPAVLMSYMVRNPGLIPSASTITSGEIGERRRGIWDILVSTWASCHEDYPTEKNPKPLPFVADLIVANPPGFGHIHCGERLGVPVHIMFTMPWAPPTSAFPHPLANLPEGIGKNGKVVDHATVNHLTYTLLDVLTWQGVGDLVNQFRTEILNLDPLTGVFAPTIQGRLAYEGVLPHTYCWSPALIPKPADWTKDSITVSGFWFLDLNTGYVPPAPLAEFLSLQSDKPVIYIGFGSIVAPNSEELTQAVLQGVKEAGVRALISKGWGTINPPEGFSDPDIFFLGNTPHDWLFPKVSLVVHHGGAGTTAAAIKAGIPSLIVPFFGDQQFWGDMVAKRGAGAVLKNKELNGRRLAALIRGLLAPEVRENANKLGAIVKSEQGEEVAAAGLLGHVESMMKACEVESRMGFGVRESSLATFTVIPQHPSWVVDGKTKTKKMKLKTGIKISTRVARILQEEGLIDVENPKRVKLIRWMEWDPWIKRATDREPVIGAVGSLLGTVVAMAMVGGVEFDREAYFDKAKGNGNGKGKNKDTASIDSAEEAPPVNSSHMDTLTSVLTATTKPIGNMITTSFKAPIDFSLSLSRGFHHLPNTLFNDHTNRPLPSVSNEIKGLGSGMNVAGKELALGFYEGFTGILTDPIKGLIHGGGSGFMKGFATGVSGVVTKPAAGLFGVAGYVGMGLVKEAEKLSGKNAQSCLWEEGIRQSRLNHGQEQVKRSGWGEFERREIVRVWKEMVEEYLHKDLEARKLINMLRIDSPRSTPARSGKGVSSPSLKSSSPSSTRGLLGKFGMHGNSKKDHEEENNHGARQGRTRTYTDGFSSGSSTPVTSFHTPPRGGAIELEGSRTWPVSSPDNDTASAFSYNDDDDESVLHELPGIRDSVLSVPPTTTHLQPRPATAYLPRYSQLYTAPGAATGSISTRAPLMPAAHARIDDKEALNDPELSAGILASLGHSEDRMRTQPENNLFGESSNTPLYAHGQQELGIVGPEGHRYPLGTPKDHVATPLPLPVRSSTGGSSQHAVSESYYGGIEDEYSNSSLESDDDDDDDEQLRRALENSRLAAEEEKRDRAFMEEREKEELDRVLRMSLADVRR